MATLIKLLFVKKKNKPISNLWAVCYRYSSGVMFLHDGTSLGLKTSLLLPCKNEHDHFYLSLENKFMCTELNVLATSSLL